MAAAAPQPTEPGSNPFQSSTPSAGQGGMAGSAAPRRGGCCSNRVFVFLVCVRTLAAMSFLGTGVAAGWGIYLASQIYNKRNSNGNEFQLDNKQFATFMGMMGVYYALFGIFGFLAEIRTSALINTVLRPFGFLHSWIGRGCFMIFIGTIFSVIPWDLDKPYVSLIPAGFDIGMGGIEILVSVLLGKDRKRFFIKKSAAQNVKAWPKSGPAESDEAAAAGDPADAAVTVTADGAPATPQKTPPTLKATPSAFANPFRAGETSTTLLSGDGADKAADRKGVPTTVTPSGAVETKNPFTGK